MIQTGNYMVPAKTCRQNFLSSRKQSTASQISKEKRKKKRRKAVFKKALSLII